MTESRPPTDTCSPLLTPRGSTGSRSLTPRDSVTRLPSAGSGPRERAVVSLAEAVERGGEVDPVGGRLRLRDGLALPLGLGRPPGDGLRGRNGNRRFRDGLRRCQREPAPEASD